MPVPLDEVDREIQRLIDIGIGFTEANKLVRDERWTLEQIEAQLLTGNEAGLPSHIVRLAEKFFKS